MTHSLGLASIVLASKIAAEFVFSQRHGPPGEAVVVAVTNDRLDGSTERSTEGFDRAQPKSSCRGLAKASSTWERILCQLNG
jgi:hypothetical protein